ncbi:unnamed protein product [Orchesella dallaii]|uniref:HMG box domain-containing protein n=1 Tax=Orchesella dallaii TaxID=48710 RepID=A0ABP1PPT5_9HEXA
MASGSSDSNKEPRKAKKKNGYFIFMEERKTSLEASFGRKLPMKMVAELLSDDWQKFSSQQKEEYKRKAREFNEILRGVKEHENAAKKQEEMQRDLEKQIKQMALEKQQNQNILGVWKMFSSGDWIAKPIVICSFSVYYEPNDSKPDEKFIPAEIGLTAFSLEQGVIDNYARIIDPGEDAIPKRQEKQVQETVNKLGIPAIGTQEQLTDCMGIVNVLECFLEQYCNRSQGSLYVFAFSRDLKATEKCLEWIFATAGRSIPVDVLNLSLYSHVASTQNNLGYRPVTREEIAVFGPSIRTRTCVQWGSDTESFIQSSGTKPSISPNRSVGKPLNGHFVYPVRVPLSLASYGVFEREDDVDFIVGCTYNYKCYKELCCIYHMLKGDGSQNCALNKSNRCAFTLLEILTMSNTVDTFPGTHYPTIDDDDCEEGSYDEQLRRRKMLSRWGITRMETDIVKRYVLDRDQLMIKRQQRHRQLYRSQVMQVEVEDKEKAGSYFNGKGSSNY